MERLFVLKTLSRTQRATKVKKFVGFSLKPLLCRDPALPPLYGHAYSRPFLHAYFSCTRMRISRVYTRMIHRRGFSTLVLFILPVLKVLGMHIHEYQLCSISVQPALACVLQLMYMYVWHLMFGHMITHSHTFCMCMQVRLLTGIGRFYEMAYILQLLMENDQFESLLHTGTETVR